jgi:hypothetical protein
MMAGTAHPRGVMSPVGSSGVVLMSLTHLPTSPPLGVMISVAGTARVVSAGGNILSALRLAVAVPDSEMADDGNSRQ